MVWPVARTFLEAAGTAEGVDLAALVRLVRLRRLLRVLSRLALTALFVWFAVLIGALASTSEESATYNWFNDHGNRGFVIILVILALDLALLLAVGAIRPSGRAAARLVPLVRGVPDPVDAASGRSNARRLLDLGSRHGRVRPAGRTRTGTGVLVLVLIGFAAVTAYTAAEIHPTYRASHGHGGAIVTIGKDSHITRRVVDSGDDGPSYTYYISSPLGDVKAEGDGKPGDGTRFTVVRVNGTLRAVHVGGHSWVTDLVIAITGFVLGALVLGALVRRFGTRMRDTRLVPLDVTLGVLAKGGRAAVRPGADGTRIVLRADPIGSADPRAVVAAQHRTSLLLNGAVLALLTLSGLVTAYA
jgi:hypothetical protein